MPIHITYGLGGLCDPCDKTHDHPFNNIVETIEETDPEPTEQDVARAIAEEKLAKLGLTVDDIKALLN